MREEALFGAGLFLIASRAAHGGVVLALFEPVEQGDGLQFVAAGAGAFLLGDAAVVDGVLHVFDDQLRVDVLHELVAVGDRFREVVAGVDVHHGKGCARGPEGLAGDVRHDDRIFAAGEKQDGLLELCGHFANDEDGFGFEVLQMGQSISVVLFHNVQKGRSGAGQSALGWMSGLTAA